VSNEDFFCWKSSLFPFISGLRNSALGNSGTVYVLIHKISALHQEYETGPQPAWDTWRGKEFSKRGPKFFYCVEYF